MDVTERLLKNKGKLTSLAKKFTNRNDVEDLVQETYYRVFRNIDNIDGNGNLLSLLVTTLKNITIDDYRKYYRSGSPEIIELKGYEEELGYYKNDFVFSDKVRKAIGKLTTKQRHCILLMYVYDFNLIETASILKITVSSVKSLTFRATQKLKQEL